MRIQQLMPVLVFAVATACATLPIPTSGSTSGSTSGGGSVVLDVVRFTNDARARNGLAPLAASSKLMAAADIQARQMAEFRTVQHTISGAQYPTLQSRLQAVDYAYSNAAENAAGNQPDAQSVLAGWMSSTGHRANILDANLREIGAAMARSAKGEPYWVQVFGTPR